MKQIRRAGFGACRGLNCLQQPLAVDRFGKNLGPPNFKLLFARGITWEKQNLETGKNFAERAAESQSIDAGAVELREEKIATRMFLRPLLRRRIGRDEIALVFGILRHHSGQLFPHFSIVVDDEQLHYCGAVSGGGNQFSSLVGSARTACNCSL